MSLSHLSFSKLVRSTKRKNWVACSKTQTRVQQRSYAVQPNVDEIVLRPGFPIGRISFEFSKLSHHVDRVTEEEQAYLEAKSFSPIHTEHETFDKVQNKNVVDLEVSFQMLDRPDLLDSFRDNETIVKAAQLNAIAWIHGLSSLQEAEKIYNNLDARTKKFLGAKLTANEIFMFSQTTGYSVSLNEVHPVSDWFLAYEVAYTLRNNQSTWSTLTSLETTPELETQLNNSFANYISWKVADFYSGKTVTDKLEVLSLYNNKMGISDAVPSESDFIAKINDIAAKVNTVAKYEVNKFSHIEINEQLVALRNELRALTIALIEEGLYQDLQTKREKQKNAWELLLDGEGTPDTITIATKLAVLEPVSVDIARQVYPTAVIKAEEVLSSIKDAVEKLPL